jgi:hypothetical protein
VAPPPSTNVIAAPTASLFMVLLFVVFIVVAFLPGVHPLLAVGQHSQQAWAVVDET